MPQQTTLGVVLFLSGRGAGGISGEPVKKNMVLMGESKEKNIGFKGEATHKIPSNFAVIDGISNNANSQPECQKPAFLIIIIIMKSLFIKR